MMVDQNDNGSYAIVLDDVFDFKRVEEFRSSYEKIPAEGCRSVSIDFTHTRYMDSSALGMLLNVKKHFQSTNTPVKLTSVNEQIRKILTISRFDQRFAIE